MRDPQPAQLLEGHTAVDPDLVVEDALAEECEAFLAGRWADCRRSQDRPLPRWAWLNQAAHADVGRLREAAAWPADKTSRRGDDIQAVLARAVLAASASGDLVRLQREVLVPLELRLMEAVMSPRRAVELVTATLFSPCSS
jgi:hypothetical protein